MPFTSRFAKNDSRVLKRGFIFTVRRGSVLEQGMWMRANRQTGHCRGQLTEQIEGLCCRAHFSFFQNCEIRKLV